MSNHNQRLNKLEDKAGGGDDLPYLPLKQDLDDPTLYHDNDGNAYHEADFEALGERFNLVIIEYTHDWRGDGSDGIQLRWPEDD